MTREQKSEALATYIRQKLHKDASSDFRHNDTTKSVEIDLVHPDYGPRVVAFSDELLDDNDLEHIEQLIDEWDIVDTLGQQGYQPLVVTNDGPHSPYSG